MPDLLTLPRRPEAANTYDDFGQPHPERLLINGAISSDCNALSSSAASSSFNGSGLLSCSF